MITDRLVFGSLVSNLIHFRNPGNTYSNELCSVSDTHKMCVGGKSRSYSKICQNKGYIVSIAHPSQEGSKAFHSLSAPTYTLHPGFLLHWNYTQKHAVLPQAE